jgi:hypothetical protein
MNLNPDCLPTALLLCLILVLLAWLLYPMLVDDNESFAANVVQSSVQPSQPATASAPASAPAANNNAPQITNGLQFPKEADLPSAVPFYDSKTGTVMSGPKFVASNIDSINHPPFQVIPPNSYLLDDGSNGDMGFAQNTCSKSCCSAQWPLPFPMDYDPAVCGAEGDYVPSGLVCNNSWQNSGCLCLRKDQYNNLVDRGGNA